MGILGQPIKESLLISDTQLGLLTGLLFAVFYATLGMPMAMWADRNNRRNLITFSVFTWSFMTAICGLAQNFWQLALARIGVGVGEAGSNPPSHSIIADLYPPEERTTAMAIFGTGINWGILLGFLIGGWVAEWYGWRTVFLVVGLPGLLLAAIVQFTIKEPPRGYSEQKSLPKNSDATEEATVEAPPFWTVARFMVGNPILRNIILAGTLMAFSGYASVIWVPTYLQRVHGLGTGVTGTYLAFIIGIGGALGIFLAGKLADKFAIIQNQTPLPMRSVAASINLFILNMIGLGAGPAWVGFMSDFFEPEYGVDALRYALMTTLAVVFWSCWHYWRAGIWLRRQE